MTWYLIQAIANDVIDEEEEEEEEEDEEEDDDDDDDDDEDDDDDDDDEIEEEEDEDNEKRKAAIAEAEEMKLMSASVLLDGMIKTCHGDFKLLTAKLQSLFDAGQADQYFLRYLILSFI